MLNLFCSAPPRRRGELALTFLFTFLIILFVIAALAIARQATAATTYQVRQCAAVNGAVTSALVTPTPATIAYVSTTAAGAAPFCRALSAMNGTAYVDTDATGKAWVQIATVLANPATGGTTTPPPPIVTPPPTTTPAPTTPTAAQVAAVLAADPAFVAEVAAAVTGGGGGGSSSGGASSSSSSSGGSSSSSSSSSGGSSSSSSGGTTGALLKWHPGHYVWLDPNSGQAAQVAAIAALSTETSVQGVQLYLNWGALEGGQGDYSAGFALVDSYLAQLAALKVPKHLILNLVERKYGTPPAAGTPCATAAQGLLPAYVAAMPSNAGCAIAAPGAAGLLTVVGKVWTQPVMDRLIALSKAYAARYDQNPTLEMFNGNGETAVAAPTGSGYSDAAYVTQLERWFDASLPAWPHTQLRLAANYLSSNATMEGLLTYVARPGVIIGGPDPELPLPTITRSVQANQLFRGMGGTDLRGEVPWVGEVQGLGIGINYTQTPAQIWTYESGTMHASYMIWYQNGYLGGAPQRWTTGILPYLQSIAGAVAYSGCPSLDRCG